MYKQLLRNGLLLLPLGIAASDSIVGITNVSSSSQDDEKKHPKRYQDELVVIDRISRRFNGIEVNDKIVLINPYDAKSKIIRTVKGLEKEWVKVSDIDGSEFMAFVPKGYLWIENETATNDIELDSKGITLPCLLSHHITLPLPSILSHSFSFFHFLNHSPFQSPTQCIILLLSHSILLSIHTDILSLQT